MSERRSNRADLASIARSTPAEARDLVDGGRAVLVDTRPRDYYEEAHAVGAVSVPFAEIRRSADHPTLRAVPREQRIILYCT
jgi:rhodanese-related sulfurtransferase